MLERREKPELVQNKPDGHNKPTPSRDAPVPSLHF